MNSICVLFLVVGLVGLKPPKVVVRPLSKVEDVVPVIFTPPPEQPKTEPEVKPDEPQDPQDTPVEMPQVIRVVAVADSPAVAFAVPVQGAVAAVAEVRYATPPPPQVHYSPPQPTKFDPSAAGDGTYPPPNYPSVALRSRYQGTVTIEIRVDGTGNITSAKVEKTSGYGVLDEAALSVVKNRWRFPPGQARWYVWPCQFVLQ